jgi:hypothetical protein
MRASRRTRDRNAKSGPSEAEDRPPSSRRPRDPLQINVRGAARQACRNFPIYSEVTAEPGGPYEPAHETLDRRFARWRIPTDDAPTSATEQILLAIRCLLRDWSALRPLSPAGEKWPHRARHGQLPQDVLDWAEVSRELEYEVVTHNDAGTNFRDIASIVEAHFHRIERRGRWNEAGELANQLIEQARDSSQPERSAASTL